MSVVASGRCDKPTELPTTNVQRAERDSNLKKRDDSLPLARIKGIILAPISSADIDAMSVAVANNPFSEVNPAGTVNAPETGTTDIRVSCKHCGKNYIECPGHPCQIKLNRYIYHNVGYEKIIDVLNVICHTCYRPRIKLDQITCTTKCKGARLLSAIVELTIKKKNCDYCQERGDSAVNYKVIKSDDGVAFSIPQHGQKSNKKVLLTHQFVFNALNNIRDADARAMGFHRDVHPRVFMQDRVYVPPPCTRPPAFIGTLKQNNLTLQYSELTVLASDNKDEGAREKIKKKYREITFNKADSRYPGKNDAQSLTKMIDGKKGIVRGFMMGKRKKHTFRTVLICDPTLKFGQIRIPSAIAKNMTTPEIVTRYNIEKIRTYFGETFEDNKITSFSPGSGDHRGIYYGIYNEDKWKFFRDHLSEGDTITRYLQDGDPVLVGRQPTISASGLMGYTAVIGEGDVIGLHMSYTTPLNADFDGDEAHGHPPQCSGAKIDVLYLTNVHNRIMDSATNGPNFGVVFNGASSGFLMSRDNQELREEFWFEGYEKAGKLQGELDSETFQDFLRRLQKHNIPRYSKRALVSTLFPRDFYYNSAGLQIINGIIVKGYLCKSNNGRVRNSVMQALFTQYGQQPCISYLTYCYFLLDWYISYYGLTITYHDSTIPLDKIDEFVAFRDNEIRSLNEDIENILEGIEDPDEPTFSNLFREEQIRSYIRARTERIENEGKKYIIEQINNPFYIMTKSGAKGSTENISQIVATVGQQLIYGSRPAKNISGGRRATPFFEFNDKSVQSRGYCVHSLSEGLDPSELFFYSMSSRVGLLDTGVNVSVTGSMQRRITKVCEDQKIQEGGEVVSVNGSFYSYQLMDNLDPRRQVNTPGLLSFVNLENLIGKLENEF